MLLIMRIIIFHFVFKYHTLSQRTLLKWLICQPLTGDYREILRAYLKEHILSLRKFIILLHTRTVLINTSYEHYVF